MSQAVAEIVPARLWSLRHGDGVEGLIGHGDVDHSILDPPYEENVDVGNDAIEVRDNAFGFAPMTDELRNRTARAVAAKTRRWALIFCSLEEAHLWRFAIVAAGMSYWRTGLWIRQNTAPQFNAMGPSQSAEAIVIAHSRTLTQRWNGGGKPAEWHAPIVRGPARIHPTQKPAILMQQLISDFTDPDELIADPFAGAATTGVSAIGLGRRFVGWELDKEHYNAALARLDDAPLFERTTAEQIELLTGKPGKRKGAAAKARMELARHALDLVVASGSEGIQASNLAQLLDTTEQDILRSLNRLKKADAVIRKGRTKSTRWYAPDQEPS